MEEIQSALKGLDTYLQVLEKRVADLNQEKKGAVDKALELQYVIKTTSDRLDTLIQNAEKKE